MTKHTVSKPRKIVVCSDGTGNAGGRSRGSNVWRIREAVERKIDSATNTPEQIVIYEDGVGTHAAKPAKILGGAFGIGMKNDLRLLYGRLIREFRIHGDEKGNPCPDELYLFGFSRGAFTIRVFANLLNVCGIADIHHAENGKRRTPEEIDELAKNAVNAYACRIRSEEVPEEFRKTFGIRWSRPPGEVSDSDSIGRVPIKFIGVWDTVDALGLPFDEMTQWATKWGVYGFRMNLQRRGKDYQKWKDDDLHDWIENAYHAMAIDDERHSFHPVLWQEFDREGKRKADSPNATGEKRSIEQVWFSGMHSNVGGGYPKDHLAHVSLVWMMRHAARHDLKFDEGRIAEYEQELDEYGKLYDSRAGLSSFYRFKARPIAQLCRDVGLDGSTTEKKPRIHASVLRRIAFGTREYAPGLIPPLGSYLQVDTPKREIPEGDTESTVFEQEVGALSSGPKTKHLAFVAESNNIRADEKVLEDTKGLNSLRRGLFYSLYLWLFALVGWGYALSSRDRGHGHWHDAQGDEFSWLPWLSGAFVFFVFGCVLAHLYRPVKSGEVTIRKRYLCARALRNVALLATILILVRGVVIDLLLSMAPNAAERGVTAVGHSLWTFTLAGLILYGLLEIGRTIRLRLRELNISAWLNALGHHAEIPRDSNWLKISRLSRWKGIRLISKKLEHPVVPVVAICLIGLAIILVLFSTVRVGLIHSNVEADPSVEDQSLISLGVAGKPLRVERQFCTKNILSTGVTLQPGWTYTLNVKDFEGWQDGDDPELTATPKGIKRRYEDHWMKKGKFLKRLPEIRYFHLLGTVGSPSNKPFIVKSGQTFTPSQGGELFLFVNDVPACYGNNQGTAIIEINLVSR